MSLFSNKTLITSDATEIDFQNVDFFVQESRLLKGVSVKIPLGKVTSIIGPSGSGKSTLLRSINRIYDLYPNQRATGSILIGKIDTLSNSVNLTKLRQEIGMVFQKPTPFPMSVFDNIAFPIKNSQTVSKKELHEKVEQLLIDVSLWEEVKDKLHGPAVQLSGGQQQRLCIARSLSTNPRILLLDEPTSALDPKSVTKLESLIQSISKSVSILLVTHNLSQARRLSEKTLLLSQGEVIEFGDTETFFTMPSHAISRDYLHL